MQITKDRIELFNKTHENRIDFEIIDKKDENQKAMGTQVILTIDKAKTSNQHQI